LGQRDVRHRKGVDQLESERLLVELEHVDQSVVLFCRGGRWELGDLAVAETQGDSMGGEL
jgi:hypothetical protein